MDVGLEAKRLNRTTRDKVTIMRYLDNAKVTQELVDAMRIHYNFIRSHQRSLENHILEEVAGIT
jgi:hypothetical protein